MNDGIYYFVGGHYQALQERRLRDQVEDKVLELETALAIRNELGPTAHLHPSCIFYDEKLNPIKEIDGVVVHVDDAFSQESTAYIVEAALSPQLNKVGKLQSTVQTFMTLAPRHEHFKMVTRFIPVLGGRHWSSEVITKSQQAGQWRVSPSGAGYIVSRVFSTCCRRSLR